MSCVVRRIDIFVERRRDLLHLERRQEAVVDAFLERVDVHRLAEIGVGVDVVFALRRGGQAELHRRRKVFEDVAPVAFVVRAAAMALVDDDEVEEVRRILAEIGRWLAVLRRPAHEGLEDREEQAAVLRHLALLANVVRLDPHQRILGERGEGVVSLIGEDVAVGEEQDARPARRFAAQIPAAMKELPGDLKRDEGLARAGGEREQDALLAPPRSPPARARRRCPDSSGSGASRPCPRTGPRQSGRARHSPRQRSGSRVRPGVGIARHLAFRPGLHVDAVDALSIGGVGEADGQFARVVLRLRHALRSVASSQALASTTASLRVAILQHIVRSQSALPRRP